MAKIKPGMLCIVVGHSHPGCPHIGYIVTTVKQVQPGERHVAPDGLPSWYFGNTTRWMCKGEGVSAYNVREKKWEDIGGMCFHSDAHLVLIQPPEETVRTTKVKTLKVPEGELSLTVTD